MNGRKQVQNRGFSRVVAAVNGLHRKNERRVIIFLLGIVYITIILS